MRSGECCFPWTATRKSGRGGLVNPTVMPTERAGDPRELGVPVQENLATLTTDAPSFADVDGGASCRQIRRVRGTARGRATARSLPRDPCRLARNSTRRKGAGNCPEGTPRAASTVRVSGSSTPNTSTPSRTAARLTGLPGLPSQRRQCRTEHLRNIFSRCYGRATAYFWRDLSF
jgi:hypothetical protein